MTELIMVGILPALLGAIFAFDCHYRFRRETGHTPKGSAPLYAARVEILLFLNMFALFAHRFILWNAPLNMAIFTQMVVLTCILGLLLLLLPILRKFLRAESCVFLWLIPVFVWPLAGLFPQWIITLPFSLPALSLPLFWIWLAGFLGVLVWNIAAHLLYRRKLLANAVPVEDPLVLSLWQQQRTLWNFTRCPIRLYISPATDTPLSISFFSVCVVLPRRKYKPDEMALIFQHELIHISRGDSLVKFILCVISGFLWFNPLAWLALRACARDLELSCDEAVLYGRSKEKRRQYAHLLLRSAPAPYGFTTCLSASANALRYRLRRIMKPGKRIVGSILLGVCFFLLVAGSCCVGFRLPAKPAEEILFAQVAQEQWDAYDITYSIGNRKMQQGDCTQDTQLLDYIAGLPLRETTETIKWEQLQHVQILLQAVDYSCTLNFFGHYVRVILNDATSHNVYYYYMDAQPDWQFLRSCIA